MKRNAYDYGCGTRKETNIMIRSIGIDYAMIEVNVKCLDDIQNIAMVDGNALLFENVIKQILVESTSCYQKLGDKTNATNN